MNFNKQDNITAQRIDDEILLLDIQSNNIHQLNPSATMIWLSCDGNTSTKDLVYMMLDHYDIDYSTAKRDVEVIINELLNMNLLKKDTITGDNHEKTT